MLLQMSVCFLFIYLGSVNAFQSSRTQNQRSSVKAYSHSDSWSSESASSSSSSSYSSSSAATGVNYLESRCPKNSSFTRCPNPCPKTCGNPNGVPHCYKMCRAYGCECYPGYVLAENGKCVKLDDCPDYLRCNDRNATFKECPNPCPGTCAFPGRGPCEKECVKNGCECKQGFYLDNRGKCVELQDCPGAKTCSINETFIFCNAGCPTNYCPVDDNRGIIACSPPYPCGSGCSCKNDYLRNTDNVCILYSDCPSINCTRQNEVYNARPPPCIIESCAEIAKPSECTRTSPSRPQCVCMTGYYRDENDLCVPEEQCYPPKCGYNEVYSDCKITCPPQTCESIFTSYLCSNETVCEGGCDCRDGYLRNESQICVPSQECFPAPTCDIAPECRPTCANPKPNCEIVTTPYQENQDGCKCVPGFILSDTNGTCIKIEECPDTGCNGDPNAIVTACPWPSPSTCDSPNAGSNKKPCDKIGCQCKSGFILDTKSGKCITPDDCECGNPCGANGTFSDCAFRCPNQYCPKDDRQVKVACKPGRPCPSGCRCKPYYLMKSYDDNTCVLASDCTPVTCTRDNEVWNPCASECLAESCNDLITKPECYPDPENCQPQCVCCEGYYRTNTGDCVPKEDCPIKCEVQQECRPTCAVPNPPNCSYIPPSNTNVDSCNCQSGYVLSECGGKCIKIEECPANQTCNGDPDAIIKECPTPCPSTCESPNAMPCKRMCDPIGCECKPGYLKSENGTCILPEECKGGNPCGANATFVDCRFDCPTNYCPTDDSRGVLICETYPFIPCLSGCSCLLNHKRLSREDPKCIVSSECPPVNCTRQYEKWNPCPSACDSEYCDAVDSTPSVCNTLVLNCDPKCVCQKSYFRNETGICVSSRECRRLNKQKKDSSYNN